MQLKCILVSALLCPLVSAASKCGNDGRCLVEDETSLMQVKAALKPSGADVTDEENVNYEALKKENEALRSENEALKEKTELKKAIAALKKENKALTAHSAEDSKEDSEELTEEHVKGEEEQQAGEEQQLQQTDSSSDHSQSSQPVAAPVIPAGCDTRVLCIGRAPYCGGDPADCTTRGLTPIGWTKQCTGSSYKCTSGWKVRCARCPSSVATVTMPPPTGIVAQWVAPLFTRRRALPPPAILPIQIPPFALGSWSYQYDAGAVGNASAAMLAAMTNIAQFKTDVSNITDQIKGIQKNISQFTAQETQARVSALSSRQASVRFAKKRVLANITVMKSKRALDDAYMAQYGAANNALRLTVVRDNMRKRKVYYKKVLIDRTESLRKAQAALRVGKIAVNTASESVRRAKRLQYRQQAKNKLMSTRNRAIGYQNTQIAQNLAVKTAMEGAYAMASPLYGNAQTRNASNVPAWGRGFMSTGSVATPPSAS